MIRLLANLSTLILFPFRLVLSIFRIGRLRRNRPPKQMRSTNTVRRNIFKLMLFLLVLFVVGYMIYTWAVMRGG